MNIQTISDQIVAILNGVSEIKYVYDYEEAEPSGYPCATVTPADQNASFADTSRNERHYIFSIKVKQERTSQGANKSENIMRGLVDSLVSTFDANYNLNNACNFAHPIPSRWFYQSAPDVDVRVAEIILEAIVVQ